ncbi:MAG: hypothetical protein Devi2KO_17300 [Devosia indica]
MAAAGSGLKVIAFDMLGPNIENGPVIADYLLQSDADLVLLNESGPAFLFPDAVKSRYPFQLALGCGGVTLVITFLSELTRKQLYLLQCRLSKTSERL